MSGPKDDRGPQNRNRDIFGKAREVAILDAETLAALRELERPGDPVSFLDDVIDAFVTETPDIIESLIGAIGRDDRSSIVYLSHQLKGLSGNIGVTRLAAVCEVIEGHADGLWEHEADEVSKLLSQAYAEAIRELEEDWKR